MPSSWTQSLETYRYPVDLRRYEDACSYPDWFKFDLSTGDRDNTAEFEKHFKVHASDKIEPWLEVVYWKLYSQPARRDKVTQRIGGHLRENGITPQSLLETCNGYIKEPTRQRFHAILECLGLGPVIAVAATFPAFVQPTLFPMVDTRVAKWVSHCLQEHNAADPCGPQLTRPRYPANGKQVLTMSDFPFVQSWTRWCRYVAQKLTARTPFEWRARDVEMAVFNAWGDKRDNHPKLRLTPLPAR